MSMLDDEDEDSDSDDDDDYDQPMAPVVHGERALVSMFGCLVLG